MLQQVLCEQRVADRKGYGSVSGCRKRTYNVNSNGHRSTKFELFLYKWRQWQEVNGSSMSCWSSGKGSYQHEHEAVRRGWPDVSQRAPELSHHGTVGEGVAAVEEEEGIVHTAYTAPWPSTPAFSSDILTLKDGTNKLSWNVCIKLPTTVHNILQDQRPLHLCVKNYFTFSVECTWRCSKKYSDIKWMKLAASYLSPCCWHVLTICCMKANPTVWLNIQLW
jgi:hypothetical protein